MKYLIFTISILLSLISCNESKSQVQENNEPKTKKFKDLSYEEKLKLIKKETPPDYILSNDQAFINQEILQGKFKVNLTLTLAKNVYPID